VSAQDLSGSVAIVSGGGRGIGLEIARELLQRGAAVALTSRREASLEEAEAALGASDRLFALQANAGRVEEAPATVKAVVGRFGKIDMLVNNVGISPYFGPLAEAPASALMKTFEVNVVGALAYLQAALAAGLAERGGAVVNVSSIGAERTATNLGAYAMTKAALTHMTGQLAAELAPRVRVNGVAPATIKTGFSQARYDGREEELLERYPMDRLGIPSDVAPAVCFLLSDEASWITGQTLAIDGGALRVDTG
jgi:NAD(P)-dependent dehydrogenase (short-subunit alcohol dehydrogenase family)